MGKAMAEGTPTQAGRQACMHAGRHMGAPTFFFLVSAFSLLASLSTVRPFFVLFIFTNIYIFNFFNIKKNPLFIYLN